jgi:glucokinase
MAVQQIKKPLTLGIDLGGTKVNVGLVDRNGRLLSSKKSIIDTSKKPELIIENILEEIDRCNHHIKAEPEALGIGVAAQVDRKGMVRSSPNLGWRNFPLKKKLEKEVGISVAVINDVNAATWGEWKFGAGKGADDFVTLFVGTGVGGGIITGGKMLYGCSNSGGELGHITIVFDGRKCHCPNSGCLEAYTGGWAIAERAQEAVRFAPKKGQTLRSLAGGIEKITAITVSRAYIEGDPMAQRLVEETGRYLAAGVVSVVNSLNPCILVLGGGVIEGIPELIPIVKKIIQNRALKFSVQELKILKAALGADAGVIGAATFAQDLMK